MKNTIQFSKYFLPAAIFSVLIVAFGVIGYITKGFTLGVDFQSGLIQEVQLAPSAFSLRWSGTTRARFSSDRSNLYIIVSGSGIDSQTYTFAYGDYNTIGSLAEAMKRELDELDISITANENKNFQRMLSYSQVDLASENPHVVHYHDPQSLPVDISEVRTAMAGINGVSVQNLGERQDRHFMIRVQDNEEEQIQGAQIIEVLESYFGKGEVALLKSDYVGSRFSKNLTDQAGMLLGLTLLLILVYASIRFKPQYAIGAVIAIINDAIVVIAFVVWTQMEFTTSTIAAILTILGYSINNTIVVFDRIRENRYVLVETPFTEIMNISLTGVLGRTIITTLTTILAILFLFIFAKGAMKDFALALIIGMISGVYTTLFISSGFVNFWENRKVKRQNK